MRERTSCRTGGEIPVEERLLGMKGGWQGSPQVPPRIQELALRFRRVCDPRPIWPAVPLDGGTAFEEVSTKTEAFRQARAAHGPLAIVRKRARACDGASSADMHKQGAGLSRAKDRRDKFTR